MAQTRNREIVVDPRFSVPPGVVDVRQENSENGEFNYTQEDQAQDGLIITTPGASVPIPSSFTIVSQRVRISPGGQQVIDVEIDFPDYPYSIDVRTTKT